MIRKKKKQIEELVTMLEEKTERQVIVPRAPLDYQAEPLNRLTPSIYDYDKAKWEDVQSPTNTNIFQPKKYLDLTEIQKNLLEDSQKEEFDKNLDKLSKIIEAKKHDEEKDLSMALQFESYRKADLI